MKKLILRLTHRLWHGVIMRQLSGLYERGKIDSRALHEVAAKFDPTSSACFLRSQPKP